MQLKFDLSFFLFQFNVFSITVYMYYPFISDVYSVTGKDSKILFQCKEWKTMLQIIAVFWSLLHISCYLQAMLGIQHVSEEMYSYHSCKTATWLQSKIMHMSLCVSFFPLCCTERVISSISNLPQDSLALVLDIAMSRVDIYLYYPLDNMVVIWLSS